MSELVLDVSALPNQVWSPPELFQSNVGMTEVANGCLRHRNNDFVNHLKPMGHRFGTTRAIDFYCPVGAGWSSWMNYRWNFFLNYNNANDYIALHTTRNGANQCRFYLYHYVNGIRATELCYSGNVADGPLGGSPLQLTFGAIDNGDGTTAFYIDMNGNSLQSRNHSGYELTGEMYVSSRSFSGRTQMLPSRISYRGATQGGLPFIYEVVGGAIHQAKQNVELKMRNFTQPVSSVTVGGVESEIVNDTIGESVTINVPTTVTIDRTRPSVEQYGNVEILVTGASQSTSALVAYTWTHEHPIPTSGYAQGSLFGATGSTIPDGTHVNFPSHITHTINGMKVPIGFADGIAGWGDVVTSGAIQGDVNSYMRCYGVTGVFSAEVNVLYPDGTTDRPTITFTIQSPNNDLSKVNDGSGNKVDSTTVTAE